MLDQQLEAEYENLLAQWRTLLQIREYNKFIKNGKTKILCWKHEENYSNQGWHLCQRLASILLKLSK